MNEEEIKHRYVIPFIKNELGYNNSNIEFEKKIKVGANTNLFLDIAVYLDEYKETIAFALDTKKQNTFLQNYKDQVISYGLLLSAPYSLLTDGFDSVLYDTKLKQEVYYGKLKGLKKYLEKKEIQEKIKSILSITDEEKLNAKKTLVIFDKRENFISTLEECENIIRDNDGKTGEDSFQELSKVLFIKIFSEKKKLENSFSGQGKVGLSIIFDSAKKNYPNLFEQNETINLSDATVNNLIEKLKNYSFTETDIDIKGKAFEIFIGNTLTGKLGQFFTPRTIVNFIVNFLPPKHELPDKSPTKIADTSCGSGGFLINILQNVFSDVSNIENNNKAKSLKSRFVKEQLYGFDVSPSLVRTSKMNMVLHGDGQGGINKYNGLLLGHGECKKYKEYFNYIYTNPPFGNKDSEKKILELYTITKYLSKNGSIDREILFTEQFANLLKKGGFLSVVFPNGILNNSKKIYTKTRELLKSDFIIIAVIGLPDKSFKSSGANSHTSILFAKKKEITNEPQPDIFMAIAKEVGFERKTKQALPIHKNDLDSILLNYRKHKSNHHSLQPLKDVYKLDSYSFILPSEKLEDRIDANYYYSKYIIDTGEESQRLENICTISKEKIQDKTGLYKYIQFSDISEQTGEIISFTDEGQVSELPSRAQMLLKENYVICARVFDSEKNVAIVPKEFSNQIASTGFVVLKPKNIPYQILYYYMRLPSTLKQIRYFCSGTILPSCRDEDILKIRVPVITDKNKIETIVNCVNQIEKSKKELRKNLERLSTL